MRRRDVLLGALSLGGAAAFGGLGALDTLARAGDHPELKDRYFIFVYFSGGWDILLSLDPRDPALFRADNRRQTMIWPAYELQAEANAVPVRLSESMTVGPFLGRLANHHSRLAIVRGMSMETLTHEVGRRRFLTGKAPSGLRARGSTTATWLAALLGRDDAIPNLVGNTETYNTDQPTWASGMRVSTVSDLLTALRPGDQALAPGQRDRVEALLAEFRECQRTGRSPMLAAAHDMHQNAQDLISAGLDKQFDFLARNPTMEALRAHYGIGTTLDSSEALAAMAVTAVTTGVSRCVSVTLANGLDTHFDDWTDDQGPRQRRGFDAVAAMVEDLARRPFKGTGDSWLDHTTIVGFSEFSRTPLLNANTGRDHSLTNACFLIGAGVKGGVYGRSSDVGMSPVAVDLATGQPDPGGTVPRPEHVLRSLFTSVGASEDLADLRAEPYAALLG
jgi:uncharacterized protein (DUF1501 family)